MSVSRDIFHVYRSVSLRRTCIFLNQIVDQMKIFFSATLCALPLPVTLLTVPVSLNVLAAC